MGFYRFVGGVVSMTSLNTFLCALAALASFSALAQPKPPDAGQILQQVQEPIRLPRREGPDVAPKPPPPPPVLRAQPTLKVTVTRFTFTGNTLYSDAQLQEVVKEFVGKSLNFDELNDVATRVRAYHRQRGYFLAQAYLPEQTIQSGAVRIAIIEGRVGVLELVRRPASRLSEQLLAGIIATHLNEGDLITETGLERPLLLINDLPTAQIASEIRRSDTIGAADLRINVDKGEGLISGYLDTDNQGNRFTGEHRFGVNVNLNTPTGWGDQLSFRGFTTDEGMNYMRLSYLRPVGYYGTRLGASISTFDYTLAKSEFEALKANGNGEVKSVYGFHPIIRTRNTNFIFQLSYEDKQLTDRIDSATPATVTNKSIGAWRSALVGDFRDGFLGGGLNAYTVSFTDGHLGITPQNQAAQDQNLATGGHQTQGEFKKYNLDARRLQRLTDNTSLLLTLQAQRANKNLASAEKFSIGGPNAVRAYAISEGTGDEGSVVQVEYRYILPGFKPLGADLTVSGFADHGQSTLNRKPNPTDNPNYRSIGGYGIGVSLGKDGNFLVKGMIAWKSDGEVSQSDAARGAPLFWFQAIKYF